MSTTTRRPESRVVFAAVVAALLVLVSTCVVLVAQSRRDFEVVAKKYSFRVTGTNGAEIRVMQNDLVHVTFSTEDIPHSFTIEDHDDSHYRIMRRAEPGKPVVFDFRADTPGRFRFYCNLTIDDRCKEMQGMLIVEPKGE